MRRLPNPTALVLAGGLLMGLALARPVSSAGWVVGTAGTILKSTDAGATWSSLNPTTMDFHAVYFVDDNTGWAVGTTGTIFKTINAGVAWTAQASGSGATLNSVFFRNSTTGWAVGTGGTILKTTNGGTMWTGTFPTTAILMGVHFVSADTGFAVGTAGTILKTINGGTSWAGTNPTTQTFNSVFFINATTGWAVGTSGTIFKTTNAGVAWAAQASGTTAILNSVHFLDTMTGFAVGTAGTILKTINGGTSWTLTNPSTATFNSVRFATATTGWAVGTAGAIYKTTNTGTSWTGTSPTTATLYGVHFVSIPISVTVNTSPVGRSFTVDGTPYTSQQVLTWASGSSHTIATTSPQAGTTGIQYVWSSWSDAGAISHTVAPTAAATYTASFTTQYMLTMTAGTGGTVSPASGLRNAGTGVSISATPNAGFVFSGWSGSGSGSYSGSNNPASITMNAPITESAAFTPTITVNVGTNPTGRSFTVDGTTYTSSQAFTWTSGTSHTIATTSPQAGTAGTRYVWANWSDGGTISHTVAPTTGTTYTANFTTQYMLTMSAGTGGSVSPASGFRDAGTGVSISATPNAGYSFSGWTGTGAGSYSGANNPASITMNAPITEAGAFTPDNVAITVGTSPAGLAFTVDGTDYTATQDFSWVSGSTHSIGTTTPQLFGLGTRYAWVDWSDGGALTHTVAPTLPTTYTAHFAAQFLLTMSANAGGSIAPPTTWYDSLATVYISATPDTGYVFDGWTGTGTGSYTGPNNPDTLVMVASMAESASFHAGSVGVPPIRPPATIGIRLLGANPGPRAEFEVGVSAAQLAAGARAAVIDIAGNRVCSVGAVTSSGQRFVWNGMAWNGARAPAGIYLLVVTSGREVLGSRRFVLIR